MVRRYYIKIYNQAGTLIHSCSRMLPSEDMAEMVAKAIMKGTEHGFRYEVG